MASSSTTQDTASDLPSRPVGRGGWVYLPEDFAQQHPLYGVYGWALLLLALLFVGPLPLVAQDLRLLFGTGPRPEVGMMMLVLATDLLFLGTCWLAGRRLSAERPEFQRYFAVAALAGLCAAMLFFYVMLEGLPRDYEERAVIGFFWRAVPIVLWSFYVLLSKRINVTTRKRVTSRDPFLRSQWLSEETPAGGISQTRRRSLFARPIRKIPVVATRPPADVPTPAAAAPAPTASDAPGHEFRPRRDPEAAPEPAPAPAAPAARRSGPVEYLYAPRRPATRTLPAEPLSTRQAAAAALATAPAPTRRRQSEQALLLDRLRRVQIAYDEGLITEEELRAKRAELLREM